ncbi:MAG: hypothetical protein ACFE85_10900 [Candidatus Hodarchaeota archaeon]
MIAYSVIKAVISKRFSIGAMFFGVLLLWIGCFLTDTTFDFMGMLIGREHPPQGYT